MCNQCPERTCYLSHDTVHRGQTRPTSLLPDAQPLYLSAGNNDLFRQVLSAEGGCGLTDTRQGAKL